ncbi:MAG: hypothetical protein JNK04_04035 [Myxococcales bacterium]|nr:hypothetical protein [Myxococcales bacterium]
MKNEEKEPRVPAATDGSVEEGGSPMKPLFLFVLLPMILLIAWGILSD